MTDITNTSRATSTATGSEGKSRALPAGTIDQGLLWKEVRQGLLFAAFWVAVGGGAVMFMTMPRHVQAMLIYGAIVVVCTSLVVAGLRRKHGR